MEAPHWLATLLPHAARLRGVRLEQLIRQDEQRASRFRLRVGALQINLARQRFDWTAWEALLALARMADLNAALARLFDGEIVNISERRPALHTALRSNFSTADRALQAYHQARDTRVRMAQLADQLRDSPVTDVIHVGIGGSDLGPRLALDALAGYQDGRFRIHFLANVDGSGLARLLPALDPARTAVVLVSKSFSTQETLLNGRVLKDWLNNDTRLYAVSANVERATVFGIDPARILPMWDWVGGRYSLWSAVGFALVLALGMNGFERLLAGAAIMDEHVRHAPLDANTAVWHALTAVWNRQALGLTTQAVLPYDERLALLPSYLQQLVMESLGKSVRTDGMPVGYATSPILWGGTGTTSQHSFFQALHQGTEIVPMDFIGVIRPDHLYLENHWALLANLLAQTQALAMGQASDTPERRYQGNRPSTLLMLDALTPEALGSLLALYEHSVYLQSVLWGINAFDQWGVELGKRLADRLLFALTEKKSDIGDDPVTRALLAEIFARQ